MQNIIKKYLLLKNIVNVNIHSVDNKGKVSRIYKMHENLRLPLIGPPARRGCLKCQINVFHLNRIC